MDQLRRQVRVARRRLAVQRFLRLAPWCLFVTLLVAAALVAIDKFYPLGLANWVWPTIALGAGVLAAAAWVGLRGQSELDAAIEIDRRFELRERVSSTFALSVEQRESPMGQALVADALRALERVEVASGFRLSLNRTAFLPLAPAALAFLVASFLNPTSETATATTDLAEQKLHVKTATQVAQKKVSQKIAEAKKQNLKELTDQLGKLEAGLEKLSKGDDDRRDALVKLNDLNKELEQRREQLRGSDKVKEQLEQLKDLAKGPADRLAEALKDGDLKQAAKELQALQEQLQSGKLDGEAKADLAKQLEHMEQKLKAAAEQHRQREDALKSQIAQKRAAGQTEQAEQLERQLAKLQQQRPQMEQLEQLAQKMGKCAECTKQGNNEEAASAMAQMQGDLEQMAQQGAEAELLDEAMAQMAEAKDAMACPDCDGRGCENCRGEREGQSRRGLQPGRGHVDADRPEDEIQTGLYDTRTRQQIGPGAVSVVGRVDGPNSKGRVEQEIQSQLEAARGGAADPLAETRLPRGYREHARTYFDVLRDGNKAEAEEGAPPKADGTSDQPANP